MMFGCSSLAEVRASRWKRSTNSLSKASENGRTLMATSRSSWRSRALKTIAMPPRPSSSTMSYSSFSSWRTRSTSETSDSPLSGVAARSRPQDRQNLLASSFWVPQREQYIRTPRESAKLRGGRDEVSTTALARDDREALMPRERDAAGGVADAHTQDVLAARDVAQLQPPVYPCDRPIARGIEPEHHGRAPAATEQASDGAEERATALSLEAQHGVVRCSAWKAVHFVIELGRGARGEAVERIEEHRVAAIVPDQPRAGAPHNQIADGEVLATERAHRHRIARDKVACVATRLFDEEPVPVAPGRNRDREPPGQVRPLGERLPRREQTGRDGAHAASRLQCERSTEPGRQRVGEAFDEFEVLHPFARDEVEE